MQVYRGFDAIPNRPDAWVSIGIYDGVHLAHRRIVEELTRQAVPDGRSLLITFEPHPQQVLQDNPESVPLLTPLEEKLGLLAETGLSATAVIPFTRELSALDPRTFVSEVLLRRCPVRKLIIGYNHAFGRGGLGSGGLLRKLGDELGFEVQIEPPVMIDGEMVSSTRIRALLLEGSAAAANRLLGRRYSISGKVVRGSGQGRGFGFPTANLSAAGQDKLIPQNGVYAVFASVRGEMHQGMCNIGTCPTVGGVRRSIETNIFDFNDDLYEETVQLEFVEKMRDEIRFDSVRFMIGQMEKDRDVARELLTMQGGTNATDQGKTRQPHQDIRKE
jgi:riboflavin kinase/FMN adenylyltransferase